MSFEDVLAEVMRKPKRMKKEVGTTRYPRVLKTELGDIWYQHEEMIIGDV